jgi:hypothetical protein
MSSLGAVETVGVLVSPISRRVRSRIWAFRLFAVFASVDTVV